MPSGPVLSDADKQDIREKLLTLCEHFWISNGYKKIGISKLCANAGISIGTFYTLYPSKEDLFLDTLDTIHKRLAAAFLETVKKTPEKEGFARAMKDLVREYNRKPFLYMVNSADFLSFLAKLSDDAVEKMKFDTTAFFDQAVRTARLTLKIDAREAYSVLSALLATISGKETIAETYDFFAVFDFMADSIIPNIFE